VKIEGPYVVIDFETRSDVDLAKCGVEKYAESPNTEALCFAWQFGGGLPAEGEILLGFPCCPPDVAAHVSAGLPVVAHNARFELTLWRMLRRRHPDWWPELRPEQLIDTMALARARSLPGSLAQLCSALRLPVEKDDIGHKLMLKMCKPRRPRKHEPQDLLLWHDDPADLDRLLAYCIRDVEAEAAALAELPPLPDRERALWLLDQRINDRGIYVDIEHVREAIPVADRERERLNNELFRLTAGEVRTPRSYAALKAWFAARGFVTADVRKDTIEKALSPNSPVAIGPGVRRALEICQEANKSSVAKLEAMDRGVCADGRVKGLLEYHGASTGRWAGRRVQPQNMMRTPKKFKVPEAEYVMFWLGIPGCETALADMHGSATNAIAWAMRSFLMAAPGHRLLSADYSNIEGRVLAWLSGETWKLDAFRRFDSFALDANGEKIPDGKGDFKRKGPDLYNVAFGKSFGVDPMSVTEEQRQIGKVQELALGYQGGHGAFLSMGKNYAVDLAKIAAAVKDATDPDTWQEAVAKYWGDFRLQADEALADMRIEAAVAAENGDEPDDLPDVDDLTSELARRERYGLGVDAWCALRIIIDGWRSAHFETVAFWKALERGAIAAVDHPGDVVTVGKVAYRVQGRFLLCRLPSGRCLGYPYPKIHREKSRFKNKDGSDKYEKKLTFWGVSSKTRKWQAQSAYGGLLAENVTQAVARDVLSAALLRLDPKGYETVLHVHDEIVSEMPDGAGSLGEFCDLMSRLEPWAEGLPVAVAGWEGRRYRK